MSAESLTNLSIAEAGALLASRSVSALDLVEATLRRIEKTEPVIHAYTVVLGALAREAARMCDHELAHGQSRGPLHGIPVGIKDLCATRNIPTEGGSRALKGFIPTEDAAVVERLRAAGAIMIGKTVTHEFAYGVNEPPTRNPWHAQYYPGGSSAGSGAAVAARSAFGAIGTDTGGSIREPASLNGVVGLKPTFGLVSRYGVLPLSPSLDHVGPLTRTVADCALMLAAIVGYDPRDSGSIAMADMDYHIEPHPSVEGLTIGVERSYFFGDHVWDDVRSSVNRVIDELADQGVRVVEVRIPELELCSTVALAILRAEASARHGRVLRERGSALDPATRVEFELGELLPATHYITAQRARALIRAALRRAFETQHLDALISPTVPTTTMPMNALLALDATGKNPFTTAFDHMAPANLSGQPALSMPCGFSSTGLPIGVQLMGRPFAESTLFRLAHAYERAHAWSTDAPLIRAEPDTELH